MPLVIFWKLPHLPSQCLIRILIITNCPFHNLNTLTTEISCQWCRRPVFLSNPIPQPPHHFSKSRWHRQDKGKISLSEETGFLGIVSRAKEGGSPPHRKSLTQREREKGRKEATKEGRKEGEEEGGKKRGREEKQRKRKGRGREKRRKEKGRGREKGRKEKGERK